MYGTIGRIADTILKIFEKSPYVRYCLLRGVMKYIAWRKEVKAMPKYTTGELAKLCNVTVRAVQYYDNRGILVPSELSEGYRRVYSEADAKKMQLICFLRELGLSIDTIGKILAEPNSEHVLSTLLSQQITELEDDIREQNERLDKVRVLAKEIKNGDKYSLENIKDIAITMKSQKELKRLRRNMLIPALFVGLPLDAVEIVTFIRIFTRGEWLPFVIAFAMTLTFGIIYGLVTVPYYYKHVAYICPECHEIFRPTKKEFFWAAHTPTTRKLRCTKCGHKGYSIEVYEGEAQ